MQDLLKKIQTASARLALPPGREAAQELPRFRAFIKEAMHRVKLAHQNGAGGLEVCLARSALVDCVIQALWTAAVNTLSAQARQESRGAHDRADFHSRDDVNWLKHSLWHREGDRLDYKPVNLKPLTVETFVPKARVY